MSPSEMIDFRTILRKIRMFAVADRGVAAVEFAMILPIMLAIYVGCTEAGGLLITDRKVQSVAGAVGDLVSRTNKNLASEDLEDYFLASTSIMSPYTVSDLLQTVTAVKVSASGVPTVSWSVEYAGGVMRNSTRHRPEDAFVLPQEMIDIARGQTVIATEADYVYRPLLGLFFDQSIGLHRSNFFLPRFGGSISVN